MKKTGSSIIIKLICISIFLLPAIIFCQKGQISGVIKSKNNKAIAFAKVIFTPANKTVYTDENGYFLSPKIDYGTHQIVIKSEDFETFQRKASLSIPVLKIEIQPYLILWIQVNIWTTSNRDITTRGM